MMEGVRTVELPVRLEGESRCERCLRRVGDALAHLSGVRTAAVNSARSAICVEYDSSAVTLERIEGEARRVGIDLAERIGHATFELRGLDCPDCAASVERDVARLPGVLWCEASFPTALLRVEFDTARFRPGAVERTVAAHGVRSRAVRSCRSNPSRGSQGAAAAASRPERDRLLAAAASVALILAAVAARWSHHDGLEVASLVAAILVGGLGTARAAYFAVRNRDLDMNALMTIAVVGACAIGDWFEGATVVALYSIGNLLQAGAMERTRRSIDALLSMEPTTARVLRNGEPVSTSPEQVLPGETLIVKPGERIPLDGTVAEGASDVDQAPITGESRPIAKRSGDPVYAGSLNGNGALQVCVTSVYADSLFARIIARVEEAQAQRAPIQRTIDRFARRYTPAVIALAVGVALAPPAAILAWDARHALAPPGDLWTAWLLRALALLLISCPCALVISTPVAIVTALGQAARSGALIKGGAFLEEIGRVRTILYDKTGTLTYGRFRIDEVVPLDGRTAREVLRIACAIERRSEHPLAAAFADCDQSLAQAVTNYRALPGLGASATVEGERYLLGNAALMTAQNLRLGEAERALREAEARHQTAIVLADERQPIGLILLSDQPRPEAAAAIRALADLGIERQVLLTGDNAHIAARIAEQAGIHEYEADLMPERKLARVREHQAARGPVAMVGDGINDAPALAAADVGIALGATASDTALETADIAVLGDDLGLLPRLVRLSRRTHRIVAQNIAFSVGTKAVLVSVALVTGLPLWAAVAGDVGVSLLVTMNSLRLRAPMDGTLRRSNRQKG